MADLVDGLSGRSAPCTAVSVPEAERRTAPAEGQGMQQHEPQQLEWTTAASSRTASHAVMSDGPLQSMTGHEAAWADWQPPAQLAGSHLSADGRPREPHAADMDMSHQPQHLQAHQPQDVQQRQPLHLMLLQHGMPFTVNGLPAIRMPGPEQGPVPPGYTRKLVCQWVDVPEDSMAPEPSSLAAVPHHLMPSDAMETAAESPGAAGGCARGQLPVYEQHGGDTGVAAADDVSENAAPRLQLLPAPHFQQLRPSPLETVEVLPDTTVAGPSRTAAPGAAAAPAAAAGLGSSALPAERNSISRYDGPAAADPQFAMQPTPAAPQPHTHDAHNAAASSAVVEPAGSAADAIAPSQPSADPVRSSSLGGGGAAAFAQPGNLAPAQRPVVQHEDEEMARHDRGRLQQQQMAAQEQLQPACTQAVAAERQHAPPFAGLLLSPPECGPAPASQAHATITTGLPGMSAYSSGSMSAATSEENDANELEGVSVQMGTAGPQGLPSYPVSSGAAGSMHGQFGHLSLLSASHAPQHMPVSQPTEASCGAPTLQHLEHADQDGRQQSSPMEGALEGSPQASPRRLQLASAGQLPAALFTVTTGMSLARGTAQPDEAAVPAAQQAADAPAADGAGLQHAGAALQHAGLGPAAVLPQATVTDQLRESAARVGGASSAPPVSRGMLPVDAGGSTGSAVAELCPASSVRLLRRAPCSEGAAHGAGGDSGAAGAACPDPAPCELSAAALAAGLPCTEPLAAGLFASGRPKRTPGGNLADNLPLAEFLDDIRSNSRKFEADGRVLRLKQYLGITARPPIIDAVLDALEVNTRIEALYIQNFEEGMFDAQLEHVTRVLQLKRIWAINVGENFRVSGKAWHAFCSALPDTHVGFMYVSEHHLMGSNLKLKMRDHIRANRKKLPGLDPDVVAVIKNMWWNPCNMGAGAKRQEKQRAAEEAKHAARQAAAAHRPGFSVAHSRRLTIPSLQRAASAAQRIPAAAAVMRAAEAAGARPLRPEQRVLAREVAEAVLQKPERVSTSGRAIKRPAVYQAVASNRSISIVEQEARRLAEAAAAEAAHRTQQVAAQRAAGGNPCASVAAALDAVARSPRRPRDGRAPQPRPAAALNSLPTSHSAGGLTPAAAATVAVQGRRIVSQPVASQRAPGTGPQPMDMDAAAQSAEQHLPGSPLQFRLGCGGSHGRSGSTTAPAQRRQQAVGTPYGGVSMSGRQRRQVEHYEAVPSTVDTQRLREQQRRQEEQRAAQLAARRTKRAALAPPERPQPPQQQRQPTQQRQQQQLSASAAMRAPDQPQVVGGRPRCQVMSDGSLWWRMPQLCGRTIDLPGTAVRVLDLPLSKPATFVLPDGTNFTCTLKRRSNGQAAMHGWAAHVASLRLQEGTVLRLLAEPRRRQQDALRVHLSCAKRGAPASAAEVPATSAQAAQPTASYALKASAQIGRAGSGAVDGQSTGGAPLAAAEARVRSPSAPAALAMGPSLVFQLGKQYTGTSLRIPTAHRDRFTLPSHGSLIFVLPRGREMSCHLHRCNMQLRTGWQAISAALKLRAGVTVQLQQERRGSRRFHIARLSAAAAAAAQQATALATAAAVVPANLTGAETVAGQPADQQRAAQPGITAAAAAAAPEQQVAVAAQAEADGPAVMRVRLPGSYTGRCCGFTGATRAQLEALLPGSDSIRSFDLVLPDGKQLPVAYRLREGRIQRGWPAVHRALKLHGGSTLYFWQALPGEVQVSTQRPPVAAAQRSAPAPSCPSAHGMLQQPDGPPSQLPQDQAMDLEEGPYSGFSQLHHNYSGEVLVTTKRLFAADTPCTLQLPDGSRSICFYQGSSHRRFADGWPAVSDALSLAPSDIVQIKQLAAGSTDFLVAKVSAEVAAAAGFSVQPMSEAERMRRSTTVSADGTVSMPLSEAAVRSMSPWLAPTALQLWGVSTLKTCTLLLPSGRRHERSIYRQPHSINGTFKGWRSATAELQLQASDTLRIQMLQPCPLLLRVSTDRVEAVTAPAGQPAGSDAAAATVSAASADGPAAASAGGPAAAGSPPPAGPASWQQWCPLDWAGTQLVIPGQQDLFSVVGTRSRQPCTLLLPGGLEVATVAAAHEQTGVCLSDGVAAVADALQLEAGSLLQCRQDAPGSCRFHVQKLQPAAATIPPLQAYERRDSKSKVAILPDGTVRWPATAAVCGAYTLQMPGAVSRHLQLGGCSQAEFQLPNGLRFVRALAMRQYDCGVCRWKQIATALQLAAGDLLHLRVSQRVPLQLQLHVTAPDGAPKPFATPGQQAQAPQPQPQPQPAVGAGADPAAADEATAEVAAAAAPAVATPANELDIAAAPAVAPGELAAGSDTAAADAADTAALSVAAQHSPGQEPSQHGAGAQLHLPHQLSAEGLTSGSPRRSADPHDDAADVPASPQPPFIDQDTPGPHSRSNAEQLDVPQASSAGLELPLLPDPEVMDSTWHGRTPSPAAPSQNDAGSPGEAAIPLPADTTADVASPVRASSAMATEAMLPSAVPGAADASGHQQDDLRAGSWTKTAESPRSRLLADSSDSIPPAGRQADLDADAVSARPQEPADAAAQHAAPPAADEAGQQDALPPAMHPLSKATILPDGEVEWRVPGSVHRMLSLPTAAVQQWQLWKGVTPCTMVLPGGRRHETQLSGNGQRPSVAGWHELAAELGIRPGNVIRMRAAHSSPGQLQEPLELYIRVRQPGSASPQPADHGAAAAPAEEVAAASPPAQMLDLPSSEAAEPAASMPAESDGAQVAVAGPDALQPAVVVPTWGRNGFRTSPRGRRGCSQTEGSQPAAALGSRRGGQQKRAATPAAARPAKRLRQLQDEEPAALDGCTADNSTDATPAAERPPVVAATGVGGTADGQPHSASQPVQRQVQRPQHLRTASLPTEHPETNSSEANASAHQRRPQRMRKLSSRAHDSGYDLLLQAIHGRHGELPSPAAVGHSSVPERAASGAARDGDAAAACALSRGSGSRPPAAPPSGPAEQGAADGTAAVAARSGGQGGAAAAAPAPAEAGDGRRRSCKRPRSSRVTPEPDADHDAEASSPRQALPTAADLASQRRGARARTGRKRPKRRKLSRIGADSGSDVPAAPLATYTPRRKAAVLADALLEAQQQPRAVRRQPASQAAGRRKGAHGAQPSAPVTHALNPVGATTAQHDANAGTPQGDSGTAAGSDSLFSGSLPMQDCPQLLPEDPTLEHIATAVKERFSGPRTIKLLVQAGWIAEGAAAFVVRTNKGPAVTITCTVTSDARIVYMGEVYETLSKLLQAVRREHPQLGRTAVSPATKAFEYCGHNLNDLSLRAYRLYQDATQLLGRMPQ